jgi:hypothetical protein
MAKTAIRLKRPHRGTKNSNTHISPSANLASNMVQSMIQLHDAFSYKSIIKYFYI